MHERTTNFISQLRQLASWLESYGDDLPEPEPWGLQAYVQFRFTTKEDLHRAIIGKGKFTKDFYSDVFAMRKALGHDTLISFKISRDEVCTKKIVRKLVPAQPAIEEHEVEEEVWDCPKSILDKLTEGEQDDKPLPMTASKES